MRGVSNLILLCQIICTLLISILSLLWLIPMFKNNSNFSGKCILYTTGKWAASKNKSKSETVLTDLQWGSDSACNFNMFVSVVSTLCGLFYLFWESLYLCRGIDNSRIDACVATVVSFIMTVFDFSGSLVISIGFLRWCSTMIDTASGYKSCEAAQNHLFIDDSAYNTMNFYSHTELAQFGAWSCFICWLLFFIMCLVKNYRQNKEAEFLVSIGKERERLIESFSTGNDSL